MRKIAFWRTVAGAYLFLFGHAVDFVKILAPWFGFIVLFLALMTLALMTMSRAMLALGMIALFVGAVLIAVGGTIYFCVAWTRIILLDETSRLDHIFGRREWRYLGISIVAGIAVLAVMAIAAATVPLFALPIVRAFGRVGWIAYFVPAIIAIAAIWVGMRLTLALPAVAIDEQSGVFARAWRRSQGNAGRLFWGTLVAAVPFAIVQNVLVRIVGPMQPGKPSLAMLGPAIVNFVLSFLETAVIIGFVAFAFQQLRGGEEEKAGAPPPAPSDEPQQARPLTSLPGTAPRSTFGRRRW